MAAKGKTPCPEVGVTRSLAVNSENPEEPDLSSANTDSSAEEDTEPGLQKKKHAGGRVGVLALYRYADGTDRVLLATGLLFAIGQGAAVPLSAVMFGNSMDVSVGSAVGTTYVEMMRSVLIHMGLLSAGIFVTGFVWQTCFLAAAERQAARMRSDYFHKVLTRDMSWFDDHEPASLPTRMANEVQTIQDAIGAKMGQCVLSAAQFTSGLVIAFTRGWELTLVLCTTVPFMAACGTYSAKMVGIQQSQKQVWFNKAGAVAEEVFAAMRVVAAFGGEKRAVERFEQNLQGARRGGLVAGCHMGLAFGSIGACFGLVWTIAFWYGAHYMIAAGRINMATGKPYSGSDIITVFFSVILGMFSLNDFAVPMMAIAQATASASDMKEVIDSKTTIESYATSNESLPAQVATLDRIEFASVAFTYSTRPQHKILNGLNLVIQRGQKVALVGESGSGKSTVIQLLERFYDPLAGSILINGFELKTLPVAAWRSLVGYVGQEPVLFATRILDNIRAGNPDISVEEVEAAARKAHAMDFIDALPQKLKTFVGGGGGQLSGGQKQRIAIARALAKQPQLLLLDEATSALDNESEKQVQAAIDALQSSASEGLTSISIAHRLSTIRNSDVIFVVKAGEVVEQGAHDKLMEVRGEYFTLVQSQGSVESDSEAAEENSSQASSGNRAERDEAAAVNAVEGVTEADEEAVIAKITSKPVLLSEQEEEQRRIKELSDMKYRAPWGRIFKLAMPQWCFFPLAALGVVLSGLSMPVQAYLLSSGTTDFYKTCDDLLPWQTTQTVYECPDAMLEAINKICLFFLVVAAGSLIGEMCKYFFFTYIQEGLILRLRSQSFESLVRQDLGFYDDPRNGPGGLTTTLARSTTLIAQMMGLSAGNVAAAMVSLLGGLSLAFVGSWKLALAILAFVPLLCVSMAVVVRMTVGVSGNNSEKYSVSGQIASEAILNIRTVRALMTEQQCLKSFVAVIDDIAVNERKAAPFKGFAFGFGNALIYSLYILGFGYGAILVDQGLEPHRMYQAIMCIILSVLGAASAVTFTTDSAKAKLAAHDVFTIIDRESQIDAVVPEGSHRSLGDGRIEFRDVRFNYPHRPDMLVLQGLSFQVSAGQSVALVGPSGSGKSTVIQLLQRFYDPAGGAVLVGGVDLRSFDVNWWRQQVGFVSQEPVLFNMSLEDNIKYGKPDATSEEVTAAAQKANMDYVLNGNVKWGDLVGMKGDKLSGGQKQRCAIARALVRDPKVLLLDEATSALDSASERMVQDALDKAREGRTTFTIAHRLSTIRDSDLILVVGDGVVAESGTHDELMRLGGLYHNLEALGNQ